MARRANPIIAFHGVESIYIYTCMFVSLARLCVVYVVKEGASFRGARSINVYIYIYIIIYIKAWRAKERAFELQTSRTCQEDSETANNCCI